MKSHLCCVSPPSPLPPPSGGECSGVKPHCTAHSAAPQVRAGHCSCGGQHLRVLQRGLNQPAYFFSSHQSFLSPADSCLFPNKSYLGMMPTEAKAFPKALLLLRRREKWKGKGLKPLKHHFPFFSFFYFADLRMPRNDPKCLPMTQTDLQSGSSLQGT